MGAAPLAGAISGHGPTQCASGAAPSPALAEALAALEQQRHGRPARAPKAKAESKPAPEPKEPPAEPASIDSLTGPITTSQLAELVLNVKRGSFNERLRRAGGARVGLEVEGWHCVGQGPGPNGGPSRWLWERVR